MDEKAQGLSVNMNRDHGRRLRQAVLEAFREVAQGRSPDDMVISDRPNRRFRAAVAKRLPGVSAFDINWALLNIRKSFRLGHVTAAGPVLDHAPH